ncbi:sulfatase/phosphatase domain-containing protein [Parafrankia sp. EAN1pec]|uniref:sulfatase/phosphatase domain-containing protein n=1 Tax=Parafrankia sp. (strain EAN1pec) TaxID=298653 RepID=UPI00268D598B
MHPCITRDPLVIAGGGLPEGQVHDGMVELVDVLPTVLELAGVPAPHRHFGRSLLPVLHDPGTEHREYAFTEGGFTIEEEPQLERSLFPYDLKSDLQHEQPELYHRATDPDEQHNLAGLPEHAAVEQRLNQTLLGWLLGTADIIPATRDPRMPSVALPAPPPVQQYSL